jgi:hypothetical protein
MLYFLVSHCLVPALYMRVGTIAARAQLLFQEDLQYQLYDTYHKINREIFKYRARERVSLETLVAHRCR